MERIVKVTEAEWQQGARGDYLAVVLLGEDDKTDKRNAFDPDLQKVLEEAKNNDLYVKVKEEKEGRWWNIKSAELVGDVLPKESTEPDETPIRESAGDIPPIKLSGQEVGMWWKELGECLRSGEIDKSTETGQALRTIYYSKMASVLGFKWPTSKKKEE